MFFASQSFTFSYTFLFSQVLGQDPLPTHLFQCWVGFFFQFLFLRSWGKMWFGQVQNFSWPEGRTMTFFCGAMTLVRCTLQYMSALYSTAFRLIFFLQEAPVVLLHNAVCSLPLFQLETHKTVHKYLGCYKEMTLRRHQQQVQ